MFQHFGMHLFTYKIIPRSVEDTPTFSLLNAKLNFEFLDNDFILEIIYVSVQQRWGLWLDGVVGMQHLSLIL